MIFPKRSNLFSELDSKLPQVPLENVTKVEKNFKAPIQLFLIILKMSL